METQAKVVVCLCRDRLWSLHCIALYRMNTDMHVSSKVTLLSNEFLVLSESSYLETNGNVIDLLRCKYDFPKSRRTSLLP